MFQRGIYSVFEIFLLAHIFAIGRCEVVLQNSNLTLEEAIQRQEEIDELSVINALSRRKRYLVFPEGSSLQLVFCLTYTTNIQIADIFYMGATASLAWQLPQDPYSPFNHHAEALHRNDKGQITYVDTKDGEKYPKLPMKNVLINRYTGEPIQPSAKKQFVKKYDMSYKKYWKDQHLRRRKIIINPALAKRSTDDSNGKSKRAAVTAADRNAMHKMQEDRDYLKSKNMNWKSVEFHRTSRSALYEKIERLLRGMGHDGRHCVLKALCETGQDNEKEQGSFLDEIMRAIFTLHAGKDFESLHHKAYDQAHLSREDCDELFPKCNSK